MNNATESMEDDEQRYREHGGRCTTLQRARRTMYNATESTEDDEQSYREHGGR